MNCEVCNLELSIGVWPFCPHEKGIPMIATDDIPGGLEVKNGVCWPDGSPRKFYTKSSIKQAAYDAGLFIIGDTPKVNSRLKEEAHTKREA